MRPIGRILLPDRVSSETLTSLVKIRFQFRSSKAQSDLERLRKELIPAAPATVAVVADPFTVCVLILAAMGDLVLYVASLLEGYCYQINPAAMQEEYPAFLVRETVTEGHFIIARSLMPDNSIEVRLDGQPIFVHEEGVSRALRRRPTSQSQLVKVVQKVIDEASSQDIKLTNPQLIASVRKNDAIWDVSDRRIRETARDIKPSDWSTPGPKSRRSGGE